MADLFHVTVWQSVESIFRDGIKRNADIRAKQMFPTEDEAELGEMMIVEEPSDEQADRLAEELIQEARSVADVPSTWPYHADGVFYWPSESQANDVATPNGWELKTPDPIVAVDSSKLPDGCTCVMAPAPELDAIFGEMYDVAQDKASLYPERREELVSDLVNWWNKVEVYTGQNRHEHEVWCGCSAPPTAIEWIYDPRREKTLYEPPDDPEQTRFLDFGGVG
ncbi:MAG: hypothetical protein ACOCR6_03605 [archaeon]